MNIKIFTEQEAERLLEYNRFYECMHCGFKEIDEKIKSKLVDFHEDCIVKRRVQSIYDSDNH